jgi:uncharacterized membrane protein
MRILAASAIAFTLIPVFASAQELVPEQESIVQARVVSILAQDTEPIDGTGVTALNQSVRAEILEGAHEGDIVTVENDYIRLQEGEIFYLRVITDIDGTNYFSVADPYRLPILWGLIGLFVACVAVFGGIQGIRGLFSLIGGLFLIFYLLLPGILAGYSPVAVSIAVASLIIGVGSYVTHGFNRTTSAAVLGMIVTILFTGALAWGSIYFGRLTGFESEEAVYLHFNTGGGIDFAGLLLGAIIIGLLGVLYDIAIGQAVSVEEIKRAGEHLKPREVYMRALRIGREHTGALVNSLAIAYVGVSLPLLLLFYNTGMEHVLLNMNKEIFAAEIVRTMVGSIGLVLAVPITTLIAVWMLTGRENSGHLHSHA